MTNHKKSHIGAGLMAGAVLGLAAGLFLQSRKGKELTKEAQKKAMQLQGQLLKKLETAGDMSKEKYEELVDGVLTHYTKTKEIANKELPEVRKFLMSRWKAMQAYLKAENEE